MFYVFVLILSINGHPPELLQSSSSYPTKEECVQHSVLLAADLATKLKTDYVIAGTLCETEETINAKLKERKS
jgi:hypothetical protein